MALSYEVLLNEPLSAGGVGIQNTGNTKLPKNWVIKCTKYHCIYEALTQLKRLKLIVVIFSNIHKEQQQKAPLK